MDFNQFQMLTYLIKSLKEYFQVHFYAIKNVKQDTQDGLFQQGDLATATATVLPLDAEDPPVVGDEPISMAERLKDNTYRLAFCPFLKEMSDKFFSISPHYIICFVCKIKFFL